MSLKHGDPPPDSIRELSSSWRALGPSEIGGADAVRPMSDPAAGSVAELLPHRLFTAGLEDLRYASNLDAAVREIGWRYLMSTSDSLTPAAAEVSEIGGAHHFSAVTKGPFVEQTASESARLTADSQVAAGEYELQALVVPAAHLFALWLKDTQGAQDIFVPLAPAPRGFVAGRKYARAEFEDLLRHRAATRLDQTPREPYDDRS